MTTETRSFKEGAARAAPSDLKAILGGSVGNLIEYFDWYVYSATAIYFAPVFFPKADATAQLLNAALVFAIGFLMRPVGAWWFGRMADRVGRKTALTRSVLLMAAGSLAIAATPGYDTLGLAAPAILLLARMAQGLSLGGEYGASATYLAEMAHPEHRGFWSSFLYVSLIAGQLLAVAVLLLLGRAVGEEALNAWAFRIPFVLGAIGALVALWLRSNIEETPSFHTTEQTAERGTLTALRRHPREFFTVVGLTLGGTVAFYTFTTYLQKFLVNSAGFSKDDANLISAASLGYFMLLQPVVGALSDRIGRRRVLLGFGALGALGFVPILDALLATRTFWPALLWAMAALTLVSGYTAVNSIVKAELFPAHVRALGVSLPYALTLSLFGGTAEYFALWFKQAGHEAWFFAYVAACVGVSGLVYAWMGDTKQSSRIG